MNYNLGILIVSALSVFSNKSWLVYASCLHLDMQSISNNFCVWCRISDVSFHCFLPKAIQLFRQHWFKTWSFPRPWINNNIVIQLIQIIYVFSMFCLIICVRGLSVVSIFSKKHFRVLIFPVTCFFISFISALIFISSFFYFVLNLFLFFQLSNIKRLDH